MTPFENSALAAAMNDAVRFRTISVLAVLICTMILNGVRLVTAGDQSFVDVPLGVPIVMGTLILYEAVTLGWLLRRGTKHKPLPTAWTYGNAVFEASIPTALAFAIGFGSEISLQGALLGPPSHLYGIFIVLGVLHVRLSLCLVAGAVAALGLASLVVVSELTGDHAGTTAMGLPRSLEGLSVTFVFLTGVAASLVAVRMRRYLETASTETERRMRAERDLQAAATIQQNLMPSEPPVVPGFEIVGWNRPADETGGDYYDWVQLDDERVAICIADVTGHGLGPAMITCFCRAYARTALRVENRIATAMNRLNSELMNDLGDGRFVTFAAIVLTPNEGRVLSSSAGHGPLLVHRHRDGSVDSFNADTLPLGIHGTDEEVEAVTHHLDDGDVFLLVTDGFFEWANPEGEQFGIQRLRAALMKHGKEPADRLIANLLRDLETFAGGTPQPDDLTAVVIKRTASGDKETTD